MRIRIDLPPATPLFFETDDDFRQRVVMSEHTLAEISAYMLNALKCCPHIAQLDLIGKNYVYPNLQIVAVEPRRITRWVNHFATEFPAAVASILEELRVAKLEAGKPFLETAYTDAKNFHGPENHYSDFGYLYARLVVIND